MKQYSNKTIPIIIGSGFATLGMMQNMGMFRFAVKVVDTFSRRGLIIKSLRPLRSLRDLLNLEHLPHFKKVSTAILNMPKYVQILFHSLILTKKCILEFFRDILAILSVNLL